MSTLQIFPHDSVGFALQSMEDSIVGGEFYPGEPLLSSPLCPICHGIMGHSDSVSAY